MTSCCCLACIEGFGRCSSAPKPDPHNPYIDQSAPFVVFVESTARGISSFKPPTRQQEFEVMARYFGHDASCVQAWNLAEPHTEEAI